MALKTELTNDDELAGPGGAAADVAETSAAAPTGAQPKYPRGPLLDLKDAEAAKRVVAMRKLRNRQRSRRAAEAQRVAYWRKGHRFVTIVGDEDRGTWSAKLPLGASKLPPSPNKVDRLIRRTISVITHDKPIPKCIPARDDDRAIADAEFSERVLKAEGSNARLNLPRLLRRVMDKSATWASGYVLFLVDPNGGGHRPMAMLAHPAAPTADTATTDPVTQEPIADGQAVERYVRPDGTLCDDVTEAAPQWLPRIRPLLLTPQNVDLLPETADSIDDAEGVTIQLYATLGSLRSAFPDFFDALKPEELANLVRWKPEDWKQYLPREMRAEWQEATAGKDGEYDDSVIVFPTYTFYKQGHEYPKGAYVVTIGDQWRLHAEEWCRVLELPADSADEQGETTVEYLELPLAQCRSLDDDVDDDAMGVALGAKLGPMDEIRASILGHALDYLYRFGNPQVYLPIGTTVQPKQLTYRTGEPIYTPMGQQPFYEQPPEFPAKLTELNAEMSAEMDDESNLQQAAQGVEDPSVQSGIHAATIVEQSNIALSQMHENAGDCYTRMCTVVLQLWRCFYDVEQQLGYEGPDGEWKRDMWIGSDLGSTKVVEIARGSFTMLAPSQKEAQATQWLQAGVIKPFEYEELISHSIAPTLGVQDNPDRQRVMGQLELWRKGPSAQDVVAAEQYQLQQQQQAAAQEQAAMQAQRVSQATGHPVGVPQAPAPAPLVLPGDPFANDQRPCDQEQDAALVRHAALRRTMATKAYTNQPKFWQDALTAEYERMRQAAGIQTVAEQADAAAQAAQLKLQIAQTPKVQVIDKNATAATIGQDVAATEQAYHGGGGAAPTAAASSPAA